MTRPRARISVSETKGMQAGITLVTFDKLNRVVVRPGALGLSKHKYIAKFRTEFEGTRYELQTPAKSRAGAWRGALRWLSLVKKGKI